VLSLSGAISTQRGVMIARCGACSIIFHSPIRWKVIHKTTDLSIVTNFSLTSQAIAQWQSARLSNGSLGIRATATEWVSVALLGQERSLQLPGQERSLQLPRQEAEFQASAYRPLSSPKIRFKNSANIFDKKMISRNSATSSLLKYCSNRKKRWSENSFQRNWNVDHSKFIKYLLSYY